jgi:hypothetical protein
VHLDLSDAAFLSTLLLFAVECWAVRGMWQLRRDLDGKVGEALTQIVLVVGIAVVLGQVFTVINAAALNFQEIGMPADLETAFLLARQLLTTGALVWALYAVRRIAAQ